MNYKLMKVCHVIWEYFPPKKGYIVPFYNVKYLSKLGYDVTVICGRNITENKSEILDRVKVCRTPFKYTYLKGFDSLRLSVFALKYLWKREFDIIHIYYFSTSFLINIFLKLLRNRAKIICDIISIAPRRKFVGTWLRRFASKTADETVVLDSAIALRVFGCRRSVRFHEVPLGVDFNLFYLGNTGGIKSIRESISANDNEILIISVGTLDVSREQLNLIKGFKIALKELGNLKLVIIGDGPDRYSLERKARDMGIESKVIFTGFISFNKVPEYLRAADIGVAYVPSLYDPQPPLKTVEYLASGLPVIATNTYGNRKFIVNNYNGILINNTVEDLANAIKKMVSDQGLRKKMASNARDSVIQYNYSDIVKDILIPIYTEICKE